MVSVAAGTFKTALDIANAACQHMGCARITSFDTTVDDSVQADELGFRYDKVRQAELRRNVWRFSIRTALLRPVSATSALVTPQAWDAAKTYVKGSVATFNGIVYQARRDVALNLEPDLNPTMWDQFYGSPMATLWDANAASGYSTGEMVYTQAGSATPVLYISVSNANADNPDTVPAWDATVTYDKGETVTQASVVYQSTQDFNINNTPTGAGAWVTVPVTQTDQYHGQNWVKLGTATLAAVDILYPLGVGPTEQSETLNIFMLPFGFMREAPQVPKAGSTGFLGAPSNETYRDWTYGDAYFVSRDTQPQRFRFAADVADVTRMDPMFCEMLGARLGVECNERVTQSSEKLQAMEQVYKKFGDEARAVNGIETGATEPALDDFIAVRR